MANENKQSLQDIHQLALSIAQWTKDKASIEEVAANCMEFTAAKPYKAPAVWLAIKQGRMNDFFDELIDAAWLPEDADQGAGN